MKSVNFPRHTWRSLTAHNPASARQILGSWLKEEFLSWKTRRRYARFVNVEENGWDSKANGTKSVSTRGPLGY